MESNGPEEPRGDKDPTVPISLKTDDNAAWRT